MGTFKTISLSEDYNDSLGERIGLLQLYIDIDNLRDPQ